MAERFILSDKKGRMEGTRIITDTKQAYSIIL